MISKVQFLTLLLIGVLLSCTKPPEYPNEPVIEFVSLSKPSMVQGNVNNDFVYVKISFTDGDGDIGDNTNNSATVYYRNTSVQNSQALPSGVPFVPEQGVGNGISGEMDIRISTSCCVYASGLSDCSPSTVEPIDTVIYEITLSDRAGNISNAVLTDPIILLCQ